MDTTLKRLLPLGLGLCLAQASAAPATPVLRPDTSLDTARRVLASTMDICHAKGKTLAAAVVDRSGNLLVLQRDDEVGPHNTIAAQRKAYTALSTKTATAELSDSARSRAPTQNLNTLSELLLLGGGVPIRVGSAVIGAVGVAGAGGPEMDDACARAGIETVFPSNLN